MHRYEEETKSRPRVCRNRPCGGRRTALPEERRRTGIGLPGPRVRGSYTVEAAFLLPVIILLLAWTLHLSINLYAQVESAAASYEKAEDFDAAKRFRNLTAAAVLLD